MTSRAPTENSFQTMQGKVQIVMKVMKPSNLVSKKV